MAANVTGHVWYKRLEPAVYWDVFAVDGTVPYGVITDGIVTFEDAQGGSTGNATFSLIGAPRGSFVSYGSAQSKVALQKTVTVVLRDFWFVLTGEGKIRISIAVCPPDEFPIPSSEAIYLYHDEVNLAYASSPLKIHVPDISHLVVAGSVSQGLNVFVRIESDVTNTSTYCSYHCNCIVDD